LGYNIAQAEHGRSIFRSILEKSSAITSSASTIEGCKLLAHDLFTKLLTNADSLPAPDCSYPLEKICHSIFVNGTMYGTRAQTVIVGAEAGKQLVVMERIRRKKFDAEDIDILKPVGLTEDQLYEEVTAQQSGCEVEWEEVVKTLELN
jgi:uncharacterized protein with NRDE domain